MAEKMEPHTLLSKGETSSHSSMPSLQRVSAAGGPSSGGISLHEVIDPKDMPSGTEESASRSGGHRSDDSAVAASIQQHTFRPPEKVPWCDYALRAFGVLSVLSITVLAVFTIVHFRPDEPTPVNPLNITPPVLPSQFSIAFTMAGKHKSLPGGWDSSTGMLHYDWNNSRQRIDHGENSSQCKLWYKTLAPCTEFFANRNGDVWVVTHPSDPADSVCCLQSCGHIKGHYNCTEDATPLPRPDYTKFTKYNGTEILNGTQTSRWDSMMVSWFTLPPSSMPFKFSTPPNAQGRTDRYAIYYDVSSMKVGPPQASLFELPSGCEQAAKKCTWVAPTGTPGIRARALFQRHVGDIAGGDQASQNIFA